MELHQLAGSYPPHVVMVRRGWPVISKQRQLKNESFSEFLISALIGAVLGWPIRWIRYRLKHRGAWTVAVVTDYRSESLAVITEEHCPSRARALERKVELEAAIGSGAFNSPS
jgi:hypothetical protein